MSFFFELLLTAFFSFLIASLLAKLFLPSSSSCSSSRHGAADVMCCGTQLSEKDRREREREEEEEQQEKIIEVDYRVVETEAERGSLDEKERSEQYLSLGFEEKGDGFCSEKKNDVSCESGLTGEVGFEKKKVGDQRIYEKIGTFEVEKSREFEEEKESCVRELGDGKIIQNQLMEEHNLVAESYNLIFGEDQTILRQEEKLGELELKDPVKQKKDEKDNICQADESTSKTSLETVDTQNSSILQEESLENSKISDEFQQGSDSQDNLSQLEGPACEIPQQEQSKTEALVPNQLKKEKEGQEKGLSKTTEGPTSKSTPPLMEEREEQRDIAFNEEEEEEEWEGIERTETEKRFSVAANHATDDMVSKLSDEVQLKLYGLRKVAIEGPCYESTSMALRSSTRAKWHAWQKLGNMNPEMAMEQYMTLLSQNVPNWTGEAPKENIEEENERGRSSDEIKNYHASDQPTMESKEGLATSASESPN